MPNEAISAAREADIELMIRQVRERADEVDKLAQHITARFATCLRSPEPTESACNPEHTPSTEIGETLAQIRSTLNRAIRQLGDTISRCELPHQTIKTTVAAAQPAKPTPRY